MSIVGALCLVTGCFGESVDPLIAGEFGLEALDENSAEWPEASASELYPQELVVVQGDEDASPGWAHVTAYIHVEPARIWEALEQADVVVDRAEAKDWWLEGECDKQGLSACLEFYTHMTKFGVDFDSITTWLYEVREGTDEVPTEMMMVYQKTWGTDVVEMNTGSIHLREVAEGITAVSYVAWLETWGEDDSGAIAAYARSLYEDTVAYVHDRPLPSHD